MIFRLLFLMGLFTMLVVAKEKAIVTILQYDADSDGRSRIKSKEITGLFSPVGSTLEAEGKIIQIHPLGLCNRDEDDLSDQKAGWVGVVKLESPQINLQPCLSLYEKAKKAIQRGATAVVFDVTDNPSARRELKRGGQLPLDRPVIMVHGNQAQELMSILNRMNVKSYAQARISYEKFHKDILNGNSKEFFDMGIFLAFFVLFCIICLIIILKLKWKHNRRQLSMSELAKQALSKLEIRKYKSAYPYPVRSHSQISDLCSMDSNMETCAVCLEEYRDGQELRILPCAHEFHKLCIDPWLIANHTCPLCLFNIVERDAEDSRSVCSLPSANVAARLAQSSADVPRIVPVHMMPLGQQNTQHQRQQQQQQQHYRPLHLSESLISLPTQFTMAFSHNQQNATVCSNKYCRIPQSQSCHSNLTSSSREQQYHQRKQQQQFGFVNRHVVQQYRLAMQEHAACAYRDMYANRGVFAASSPSCKRHHKTDSNQRAFSGKHASPSKGGRTYQQSRACVQHPQVHSRYSWTKSQRSPSYQNACKLEKRLLQEKYMDARYPWVCTDTSCTSSESEQEVHMHSKLNYSIGCQATSGRHVRSFGAHDSNKPGSHCDVASDLSNMDVSNHSTFGSSDLPSEVSSYNSNVYGDRVSSPVFDEGGDCTRWSFSSTEPPPVHLQPHCLSNTVPKHSLNCCSSSESVCQAASLRPLVSENNQAVTYETVSSQIEDVSHIDCISSQDHLCSTADIGRSTSQLSLSSSPNSGISAVVSELFENDSSNNSSIGCPDAENCANQYDKENCTSAEGTRTQTEFVTYDMSGQEITYDSAQSRDIQPAKNSHIPQTTNTASSSTLSGYNSHLHETVPNVTTASNVLTSKVDTTVSPAKRFVRCQAESSSENIAGPMRSVVIFSEPHGTVITLPLEESEKFDPVDAV